MHGGASLLARLFVPALVFLMSLGCLILLQGSALAAPATPTAVSPDSGTVDVSANPTLQGSAYSGSPGHQATEWRIDGSSDFSSPDWNRTSASPETQTVVNETTGTFANDLAGMTRLRENERYYWNVRYQDTNNDWSEWSDYGYFMTATTTWYLAEGSTAGGMETWVLVQNPGNMDAKVNLQFQTDTGPVSPPGLQDLTVPHDSRISFFVGSYVTTYNVSTKVTATEGTIVCERAMYGNERAWGHDSIGVALPSSSWYLAEGCTAGGMETWVLVQNPNPSVVTVDFDFMTSQGFIAGPQCFIPANSRFTLDLLAWVSDYNVSTKVVSTGGDVICERAMYGNGRQWAHDSIGTTSPSFAWFFAEGCTGGYMQTWILIQNPESYSQKTKVFLMSDEGPLGYIPVELPAYSRFSMNVADYVELYNVSATIYTVDGNGDLIDTGRIVCERAMYDAWQTWGHDSIGTPIPPSTLWTLPEGSTAGGMETWVLVQNPINTGVNFSVHLMTESGIVKPDGLQDLYLPEYSRLSINLGQYVSTYNVSTWIDADSLVVCERSMYGYGRQWAHNSIGYGMGFGNYSADNGGTPTRFNAADIADSLDAFPRLYPR